MPLANWSDVSREAFLTGPLTSHPPSFTSQGNQFWPVIRSVLFFIYFTSAFYFLVLCLFVRLPTYLYLLGLTLILFAADLFQCYINFLFLKPFDFPWLFHILVFYIILTCLWCFFWFLLNSIFLESKFSQLYQTGFVLFWRFSRIRIIIIFAVIFWFYIW